MVKDIREYQKNMIELEKKYLQVNLKIIINITGKNTIFILEVGYLKVNLKKIRNIKAKNMIKMVH